MSPFKIGQSQAKEEVREFSQRLFVEVTPAVEIVAARLVTGGKMALGGVDVAREAARDRPDCACVQGFKERCV